VGLYSGSRQRDRRTLTSFAEDLRAFSGCFA
jgi:hypothetical protein